ncbi:MAG: aminotransferase class I/II-fold pyridoxal phosphate-dependent enzyme [Proteobacteria bacterium]|nr:aminotransferase class I/II-fold pyridoxal phosphate-dependent enzyme [Pseudomonadota bacterium]
MQIQPFRLERFFAKYEFNAPYLLCCSDCESMSIGDLFKMEPEAEAEFKDLWLGYTESQGHPLLREEIAKLYDGVSPDQVLVHTGAEEAIFNTMNAMLQPGDHVIVQFPCYQSLAEVAQAIGCEVSFWRLEDGPAWKLDFDYLSDQINPQTKLIIVNSPHNPTGYQMTGDEYNQVIELARQNGICVFSDEVYRFLEYEVSDRLPSICEVDENGIALGVMSKSFGLPGLRIGWIVTRNKEMYHRLASFKDYTTICNSAPSEFLSILGLKNKEKLFERNLSIIAKNLGLLDVFFERHEDRFSWVRPKAGPIAFPGFKQGKIAEFCNDLVQQAGVLLVPGSLYDPSYNNFRIGFGRANMQEALGKLEDYLAN